MLKVMAFLVQKGLDKAIANPYPEVGAGRAVLTSGSMVRSKDYEWLGERDREGLDSSATGDALRRFTSHHFRPVERLPIGYDHFPARYVRYVHS
jgi:hypothetical protein